MNGYHLAALGVLEPDAPDVDDMLDEIEDVAFLQDGFLNPLYTAERNRRLWFDCGGFSKYYVGHNRIAELYARRDEVKPFIRSLFNCIPAALVAENLTFWEHGIGAAWDKTHHTANILLALRAMFVYERGHELWLAAFVPAHYLADGATVRVEKAPSAFGDVSYRLRSSAAAGTIEAEVDPPTRKTPARHPEDRPIAAVVVNGRPHPDFDAARASIALPADAGALRVTVRYADGNS